MFGRLMALGAALGMALPAAAASLYAVPKYAAVMIDSNTC
jgi:hypothetical protein